jgi:sec-independent protein translocase protein TatC
MLLAFCFHTSLIELVQRPLWKLDPHLPEKLQVLSVTDPMIIVFEVSFYAGIVITFPMLLFFIAQFVLPALTPRERKIVVPVIVASFFLFMVGVLFCYFWVLPQTLAFFFGFARSLQWAPTWQVREYFGFVTQITLAFGLAFELPVVVVMLVYFRVLTSAFLRRTRPFAIVIVFLLAALIAPTPDPVTFLSLGVPMCLLYELCIWLGWFVERAQLKNDEEPMT